MEKIIFMKPDGSLDPILYSKIAEDMAKELSQDHFNIREKPNKRSQVRKFFDEINRLEGIVQADPDKWRIVLPQIHMLVAKSAYAEGRKLVSRNFAKFIKDPVDQIDKPEKLTVFSNFFEAFIGFYRLHGPSN